MLRLSLLMVCLFAVASCTTVKIKNAEKASMLNADLGLAYLMKGRNDQALEKLNKAILLNPDNARAYLYTAELYWRIDQTELAIEFFKRAIETDPDDSSISNNYGAFLCAHNKYGEAFEYFQDALKNPVYKDRAKVFENIGICSEEQGNLKVARKNYIRAIQLKPSLKTSLLAVAQLDFDSQNIQSAAKYLRFHNGVAKDSARSLWLGILIAKKNRNKKVIAGLSWSLERKFPKSKEAKLLKRLKESGGL